MEGFPVKSLLGWYSQGRSPREDKLDLDLGSDLNGKDILGGKNSDEKNPLQKKHKICSGHRKENSLTGWEGKIKL